MFDHVFQIALQKVQSDTSMAEIIVTEHNELEKEDAVEVKSILEDQSERKLLLLDGYDEYQGRNKDIDDLILKKKVPNCWLLLTSRETDKLYEVRDCMDAEAEIVGFSQENIPVYIRKYLGSEEKTETLLYQAKKSDFCLKMSEGWRIQNDILKIPILLCMICFLFLSQEALPDTKAGIYDAIVERIINREAVRTKKNRNPEKEQQALIQLGKLAWKGLQEDRLIFEKVRA